MLTQVIPWWTGARVGRRICWLGLVTLVLVGACNDEKKGRRKAKAAAVEVAPIARADLQLIRQYSGTLEATQRMTVGSLVGGLLQQVHVDLGDTVSPSTLVAQIDDHEYRLALLEASAELAVAEANSVEAEQSARLAKRDLQRATQLRDRGVFSQAQLDSAEATQLTKDAAFLIAKAHVARTRAARDAARLRLSYTKVTASWPTEEKRLVAERFVDAGALLTANQPIVSLVALDPIRAVINVPEQDYGRLKVSQKAVLQVDTSTGSEFDATVHRIAPVFQPGSRQARVELSVPNTAGHLKPGMFVRATIRLGSVKNAVIVSQDALTTREDVVGVFVLQPDNTVKWHVVTEGARQSGKVQLLKGPRSGHVVVLGHQLIDDGSKVLVPDLKPSSP